MGKTETVTGTVTTIRALQLVGWSLIIIDDVEARIGDATLAETVRAKGNFLQVGDTVTATIKVGSHATTGETIRRVKDLRVEQ